MAFRIPGETPRQAAMRQRVERANKAQEERENQRKASVEFAIAIRELQTKNRDQEARMWFDLYLIADRILARLEEIRDENAPKHPEDEWNEDFCIAIELIPEAKMFVEECLIRCTKEV